MKGKPMHRRSFITLLGGAAAEKAPLKRGRKSIGTQRGPRSGVETPYIGPSSTSDPFFRPTVEGRSDLACIGVDVVERLHQPDIDHGNLVDDPFLRTPPTSADARRRQPARLRQNPDNKWKQTKRRRAIVSSRQE
jgi:hypothetical protein